MNGSRESPDFSMRVWGMGSDLPDPPIQSCSTQLPYFISSWSTYDFIIYLLWKTESLDSDHSPRLHHHPKIQI